MRRALLAVLAAGLVLTCHDAGPPTAPGPDDVSQAISDGTGTVGEVGDDPDLQSNPRFFWLSPMVPEPDHALFGTFAPAKRPTVRIVCLEDSDPNASCDPDAALATFTVGDGLVVEDDHYKAELATKAAGLEPSSGEEDFTTYRIEVLTPPLGDFGGPFVIGFADFQMAENGQARNPDGDDGDPTIELKDGRTLPIRFRLDEGVLEEELEANTAPPDDATDEEAFCQINCSVTVVDRDEDTEASLFDEDGEELTAMLIPAGAVWTDETSVLVIDEREDDGDTEEGELCLPFGDLRTEACFRYELSPDNPAGNDFTESVRFGICPEGQAVSGGSILETWRLLKADEVDGEVVITRPDEVDVSDFLQCDVSRTVTLWDGPGGRLAGSALQWLVAPLRASDWWGGQLQDLSDLFWGEDVVMTRVSAITSAVEGTTLQMTVELSAVHPDPDASVADREVTFERTTGSLSEASGFPAVSSTADSIITVETDGSGNAIVNWQVFEGANRLEVTSPDARPADGEPDPLAFEVTGTAAELAYVANVGSDDVSVIDVSSSSVVATIGDVGTEPIDVAVTPDGTTAYVANFASDDVSVIDVATFTVTDTIGVGETPVRVAVTPDGTTAYVANQGSDEVSVIDVASNSVTTAITVSGGPTDVAVSPDGTTVYVAAQFSDDVAVIDRNTNTVSTRLLAGDGPSAVAVTPDGETLYVANNPTSSVTVIEVVTSDTTVIGAGIGAAPRDVAFTPDGSTAFVPTVDSDNTSVIDVSSGSVVAAIGTGDGSNRAAVSPDGDVVYVTNRNADDVAVIDVGTNVLTDHIVVGSGPAGVAFLPPPPPIIE